MSQNKENTLVRKCSYDPSADVITVQYDNSRGPDKKELYLEVKYRELWFQKYCEEKKVKGSVLCSDLRLTPVNRAQSFICQVTAQVIMDDVVISQIPVAKFVDFGDSDGIQCVVTTAIGRALKDAGFGTLGSRVDEEGERYPCDAGITIRKNNVTGKFDVVESKSGSNPAQVYTAAKVNSGEAAQPNSLSNSAESEEKYPDVAVVTPAAAETLVSDTSQGKASEGISDEKNVSGSACGRVSDNEVKIISDEDRLKAAYLCIVPCGAYKGKTISEVVAIDSKRIEWFASDKFSTSVTGGKESPERKNFKASCELVINALKSA